MGQTAEADLAVEEFPLPPDEVLAQMLEEELGQVARENVAREQTARDAAATPAETRPAPEVAALDFVGGPARSEDVPLVSPFDMNGATVTALTVRRLTGFEVAALAGRIVTEGGDYDLYEVYAAMTRMPAPVLRGLDQDDGLAVVDACQRFLPRVMRAGG